MASGGGLGRGPARGRCCHRCSKHFPPTPTPVCDQVTVGSAACGATPNSPPPPPPPPAPPQCVEAERLFSQQQAEAEARALEVTALERTLSISAQALANVQREVAAEGPTVSTMTSSAVADAEDAMADLRRLLRRGELNTSAPLDDARQASSKMKAAVGAAELATSKAKATSAHILRVRDEYTSRLGRATIQLGHIESSALAIGFITDTASDVVEHEAGSVVGLLASAKQAVKAANACLSRPVTAEVRSSWQCGGGGSDEGWACAHP